MVGEDGRVTTVEPEGARVRVRDATAGDAAAITAVAATRGALPQDHRARVGAWVGDRSRHVVVAEVDGDVVGWAMLARWTGHDDAPEGWFVSALTVLPERRGCGTGGRLLADVVRRGAGSPVHSVVNATNVASLAVHRRRGFTEVGRAARYAGIEFDGGTGVLLRHPGGQEQG